MPLDITKQVQSITYNGTTWPLKPPVLQDKTVSRNGTVTADSGYDGLGTVTVDVSGGGGGAGDYEVIVDNSVPISLEQNLSNWSWYAGSGITFPNAYSNGVNVITGYVGGNGYERLKKTVSGLAKLTTYIFSFKFCSPTGFTYGGYGDPFACGLASSSSSYPINVSPYSDYSSYIRGMTHAFETYANSTPKEYALVFNTGNSTSAYLSIELGAITDGVAADFIFSDIKLQKVKEITDIVRSEFPYGDKVKGILKYWFDGINNQGLGSPHSTSATTWKNLSGNNSDGVITNGAWGADHLEFNGSTTWVNCGICNPAAVTVEAVVKFNSVGGSSQEFNAVAGNWQSGGFGIQQKNAKNAANVNIRSGSSNSWSHLYGSNADTTDIHVLTVSYDGDYCKFYEDGVLMDSVTVNGIIKAPSNNTVFSIGSNPDGTSLGTTPLDGNVYSVRVWSAGLSADMIAELYQEMKQRFID